MKALIATKDSVIGAAVYRLWQSQGHTVIGTTRFPPSTATDVYLDVQQPQTWRTDRTTDYDTVLYTIASTDASTIEEVFAVNTIATFKWLDDLASSARIRPGGTIAVLTSQFGSVSEVINAQAPWYRMSKAALNMGLAILNKRYRQYRWLAVHPGLVDTPMTKGLQYSHEKLSPDASALYIDKLLCSSAGFGFYDAPNGRKIPW